LVNTRIQLGDLEGAIAPLEKLIALDPQDYRPVLVKATILKQQGKTAQAKALFEQAAALAPAEAKEKINQLATPQPAASTPSPVPKGDKGTR
jgi:Flp pilus assembly protein TadD